MRWVAVAFVFALAGCAGAAGCEGCDTGGLEEATTLEQSDSGDTADVEGFQGTRGCPTSGDGRVDVERACVDGACSGDRFADLVRERGEPRCDTLFDGWMRCGWADGLGSWFDDLDENGKPDPDAEAWGIALQAPFVGTTSGGLGLGAAMDCFVEAYGEPTHAEGRYEDGAWEVDAAEWDLLGLYAYDGADGQQADGAVDAIVLFGSVY